MHSRDFAYRDGRGTIHYNGDWSGRVIIDLHSGAGTYRFEIPAEAIRAAAYELTEQVLQRQFEKIGDAVFEALGQRTR